MKPSAEVCFAWLAGEEVEHPKAPMRDETIVGIDLVQGALGLSLCLLGCSGSNYVFG